VSIQSKIDYHLSKDGGYQYNIVVRNETGKVKLPKGVNVSLYDCDIVEIDATAGENSIFIGGDATRVQGLIDQHHGNFAAENCVFFGEIFWRKNTRVKLITKSKFEFRVNAQQNTYVDIFDCVWDGVGSYGFLAQDHCRINISKSIVTRRQKGVWAQQGSVFDLNNVIIGTETGIILEDNAQVNMIGGQIKCTLVGITASNKSQVYLSRLDKPISTPVKIDVMLDNWSKLVAHGTDMENALTAIKASNYSTVEVMDCDHLKSLGEDCIIIDENSTARFVDVKSTIESLGGNAITASNHSTVNAIDVKKIDSLGGDGVSISDNHTKFEATGKGNGIISGINAGVRASNKCSVGIDHYQQVKGTSESGIVLENDSQALFTSVQELSSDSANGALLSNESDISFQDHQAITGTGGSGIVANNNCTVNLQTVQSCTGVAGDGIMISNGTELDVIYTSIIDGKAGFGINASVNCDVHVSRSNLITGTSGGIQQTASGSLDVKLLTSIAPKGGSGILTTAGVDTILNQIDSILFGLQHVDCNVKIKDCKSVKNTAGAAVTVTGGEIEIIKIVAQGSGLSMSLNGTHAKATSTVLNQAVQSTSSEIEFNNVTLSGSLTSTSDTLSLNRGAINGSLTATGSDINLQLAAINGSITITGGSFEIESSACSTAFTITGAYMKAMLSIVPALTLAGASAAHLMGGAYGIVTVDASSSCIAQNASCTFAGLGGVISVESGALIPGLNGISIIGPIVRIQDTVNDSVNVTAGVVTVTDAAGDTIVMTASSITASSLGVATVETAGALNVIAGGAVAVTAAADLLLTAATIEITAASVLTLTAPVIAMVT
jgi:hypothetical protein